MAGSASDLTISCPLSSASSQAAKLLHDVLNTRSLPLASDDNTSSCLFSTATSMVSFGFPSMSSHVMWQYDHAPFVKIHSCNARCNVTSIIFAKIFPVMARCNVTRSTSVLHHEVQHVLVPNLSSCICQNRIVTSLSKLFLVRAPQRVPVGFFD